MRPRGRTGRTRLLAVSGLALCGLIATVAVTTPRSRAATGATPVAPSAAEQATPTLGRAGDVISCGVDLRDAPDAAMGVYRSGSTLEVYIPAGVRTYRCTGQSMARLSLSPATPVLGPSGSGFDASYAGIAAVINPRPATDPSLRIGYYHAEQHCPTEDGKSANSVGMAISHDAGRTWSRQGVVISGPAGHPPCEGFTGVGQPSAIVAGGYVYVYFTDWSPGRANSVGVARAPLGQADDPASYRKYTQVGGVDGWNSPAQGGDASPVIVRPAEADVYAAAAQVTYNTALSAYLAVFETNRGFATTTSSDLVHWSPGQVRWWFSQPQTPAIPGAAWQSYLTLLAADIDDPMVTGTSNWLYFAQGRRQTEPHHMVRTWFAFGPPALPQGFGLAGGSSWSPGPSQSPFAWVCGGDVQVSRPDGSQQALYDSASNTGVVVALASGNEATTVTAPWGASCRPEYAWNLDSLIDASVSEALRGGCGSHCDRMRLVVLDAAGRTVRDEWRTG